MFVPKKNKAHNPAFNKDNKKAYSTSPSEREGGASSVTSPEGLSDTNGGDRINAHVPGRFLRAFPCPCAGRPSGSRRVPRAIIPPVDALLPISAGLAALGGVRVVPGVRPTGAASEDQRRVATPKQAVEMGATWIVVGRPIVGAADPVAAAQAIAAEIA